MQAAENNLVEFAKGFVVNPLSLFLVLAIFTMVFTQTKVYKKWRGLI